MKELTNAQWDAMVENIAKRIENEAKSPEEAAKIAREFKTKQK